MDHVTAPAPLHKPAPHPPFTVLELASVSDNRRWAYVAGGIPLVLLLLLVAAWGIDTATSSGRVARNVYADDRPLTGLDESELLTVALDVTDELRNEIVSVDFGPSFAGVEIDPVALGGRVDGDRLIDDALHARRGGFVIWRPFRWASSLFSRHEVTPHFVTDPDLAAQAATQLVAANLDTPTEPAIELSGGSLVVVPGVDGATLDADEIVAELPAVLAGGAPYRLALTPQPLPPELDVAFLDPIAAEANAATAADIDLQVLGSTALITVDELRSWVLLDLDGEQPTWTFDEATLIAGLQPKFPALGTQDQQAHFDIVDGKPVIIPASESVVCCAAGSGDALKTALLAPSNGNQPAAGDDADPSDAPNPGRRVVELSPDISDGGAEGVAELESLGIVEKVSEFTTKHDCCQNRVTNIHLMADIVKGTIVRPGETFSLNGLVGKRTIERGFLPAGAIAQGVLEDQVGGGVSQFATTIFNAVFFAGLDFVEYQSHSLYFSRYPRGREATVSWPKPDFRFTNNTPYGVLIWPSYTGTTITVAFYSTKHIDVEDLGRSERPQGVCTRVTTTRKRTWEDGTSKEDTVFAVYRPEAGLDCAGNPTIPTTTVPEDDTTSSTDNPDGGTETTSPPTTAPPPTTQAETTTTAGG